MIKQLRWWQWLILALLLLLIGVLALVPEWKQQTIDTGYSDAALRNPYLAAQRLAEQSQGSLYVTRELKLTDSVLDQYNTLVLQNTYAMLNERQLAALTTWLSQGGRLIIGGYTPDLNAREIQDVLFEHLNIEVQPASSDKTQDALDGLLFGEQCDQERHEEEDIVYLDGYALQMQFYSDTRFYSRKQAQSQRHLVRQYGAGDIVMLPDLLPFSNLNLLCSDHSEAAWVLLNDRRTLWLWAAPASNWLTTLINALPLSSALALLSLLLWLWRRASRVGPARQRLAAERPAISEHHAALAHKLWKQADKDAFYQLLAPLLRYAKRTLSHQDYQQLQPFAQPQNDAELLALYKRLQQLGVLR